MSTPARTPLPNSSIMRDLHAVCYPYYLDYAAYTDGMDKDDPECVLELTHELDYYFEHEFPLALLAQALDELKPRVLLLPVPSEGRTDWPWLEEANLERVADWCSSKQYPHRPGLLDELMTLLGPRNNVLEEPQPIYRRGINQAA